MQLDYICPLIAVIVEVFVLAGLVRMILHGNRSMTVIFFTFAMASLSMSYVYWLVFSLMRPNERLVFAANEISEWALFLMYATSLSYMFAGAKPLGAGACVAVILFIAANAALWIGWSGEWIQDIVTGLCLCSFAFQLVRGLIETKALKGLHWFIMLCLLTVSVGTQAASFLKGAPVRALYLVSFLALSLLLVLLYIWTFYRLRKANTADEYQKVFCLALLLIMTEVLGMYMSGNPYYLILSGTISIAYLLAYIPLRKGAVSE